MPKTSQASSNNIISPRTVIALLVVMLAAFTAALTLAAWSPELADKDQAGGHAYSSSALGYKAYAELLQRSGSTITYRRNQDEYHYGLSIITPPLNSSADAMNQLMDRTDFALVVLPKWRGRRDSEKPSWLTRMDVYDVSQVNRLMQRIDEEVEVSSVAAPAYATMEGERYGLKLYDTVQVFSDHNYYTLIDTPNGALAIWDQSGDRILLSDPDVLNTIGLATLENARLAKDLSRYFYAEPPDVSFDVTLHGFSFETSLLRILLDLPFLSVTLVSLAGAALLGWGAAIRFGSPEKDERVHALGKEALADHTAGLFKMARREHKMAPGYLVLQKEQVCEALRIPRHLDEKAKTEMLDRLGEQAGKSPFSLIEQEMTQPSKNVYDLIHKAQRLHRWRQEMLNEPK